VKASVNLRGDLAKLSDAELAARLEATWQALDAARSRKSSFWTFGITPQFWLVYPWRGPFRHPRFYRFWMMLSLSRGNLLAAVVAAAFLSGKKFEQALRHDADADQYLSITEVRDIMDEIERRLAMRGRGKRKAQLGGARQS
jgi:hypothetical protein